MFACRYSKPRFTANPNLPRQFPFPRQRWPLGFWEDRYLRQWVVLSTIDGGTVPATVDDNNDNYKLMSY